jgi:biotin carboxylase
VGDTLLIVGLVEGRELALRTALERGLRIVVIDFADSQLSQMAHVRIPVADLFDRDQLNAAIETAVQYHPSAVLSFYDELLEPTAQLAQRLGCRFLTPQAARLAYNKVAQRAALRQAGVSCPRWADCSDLESVRAAAREIGYPLIIKTADQAGAIGKIRVFDAADLEAAYAEADLLRIDRSVPLLVEQLAQGKELSVDGFVVDGRATVICLTSKTALGGKYPVELSHVLPYTGPETDLVVDTALRAATALGVNDAMMHVELMVTDQGPVVIEANVRSSGDRMQDMMYLTSGCNTYDVTLDLALGITPTWRPRWRGAMAIHFLIPDRAGVLAGFQGVAEVLDHPDVYDIGFCAPVGSVVPAAPEHNGERLAYIICAGADWQSADQQAAQILTRLSSTITVQSGEVQSGAATAGT